MGLFRTTVNDVHKYKEKGKVTKLLNLLKNKNENVVVAAINALVELNAQNKFRDMIRILSLNDNNNIRTAFLSTINSNKSLFLELLVRCWIRDIQEVARGYKRMNTEFPDREPDRIIGYEKYIMEFISDSKTLVVNLLQHHSVDVRVYAAEMLKKCGDENSKEQWENILSNEEKTILINKNFFHYSMRKFLAGSTKYEIPVYDIMCYTVEPMRHSVTDRYILALTDINLYLIPDLAPGFKGVYLDIPISSDYNN